MPWNAADPFRAAARRDPGAPALRTPAADGGWNTATYGQLDRHSDALARGFRGLGVRPGDRSLVLLRPSADLYASLLALFKLGAVPVLIDPGMGAGPVLDCVRRTAPRVLVAERAVHALAAVRRGPFRSMSLRVCRGFFPGTARLDAVADAGSFEPVACAADDDAAILFTSGSTGPAKGVANRQEMFAAQVEALRDLFRFRPGATDVQCFAAFALFDLALGNCSVLPHMDLTRPASADPAQIVRAIETFSADIAFASPVVWQNLVPWCLEHDRRLGSLETVLTVGAPIPAALHADFRRLLRDGAQVHTPYGATEAMPLCSIASDEVLGDTRAATDAGAGTCVGRPLPGVDLRVAAVTDAPVATWTPDLVVADGQIGEVVVGGSVVSHAYRDAPDANVHSKIQDGHRILHRTGDLGRLDASGRLWFCGRKAHRIRKGGRFVAPVPLENIANRQADIRRTALVGVGSATDQDAVLCVEMKPGRTFDDVVQRDLRRLLDASPFAGLVRHVLPHPGFPTDARHNSKIRSEVLAAWAAERLGAP